MGCVCIYRMGCVCIYRMHNNNQFNTLPLSGRVPGPTANLRAPSNNPVAVAARLQLQQRMIQQARGQIIGCKEVLS